MAFSAAGPKPAFGQVFKLEAGTSSLYQAHGGSLGFRTTNYDGWVGLGSLDGFRFGAFTRTKVRGSTISFGDDAIPFRLGTDIFDTSHYFMGRGVGLTHARGPTRIFGFAGATSLGLGTLYFRAGDAEKGVGLVFLDRQLTPTLSVFSRTVISSRQTAINGLEWQPRSGVRAAVAGGMGANQGYAATSFTIDRDLYTLKAAYNRAGDQFRRITVQQPLTSEVDRENVMLTLRPAPSLAFTVGRQNFLQPFTQDSPVIRGSVNQYAATFSAAKLSVSSTLFDSRAMGLASRGASFSAGRDVFSRLHVTGNYLWNRAGNTPAFTSTLGMFRETLSPRLTLLQLVNRAQGRTTVSFGGNLVSNRVSVGVEYQTLYLPFRTGNQFKQALVLNFQFRPFGNYSFNAGSYVTPDGTVKYTAYGGTFMYRGPLGGPPGATTVTFHKYVVLGRVVDESGKPVRGAALRVDGDVVYSDSDGVFFSRRRRPGTVRFEILLKEFVVPGQFEVVSVPASVKAEPEGSAHEITVVVRRLSSASRRRAGRESLLAATYSKDRPLSGGEHDCAMQPAPTAPREVVELPLVATQSLGLLIPFEFCRISELQTKSDKKYLNSRLALPMGLGGGPNASGEERGVPRGRGTKSVQGASNHLASRRVGGTRSRVRPSRVRARGRHARRARSGVVRPVSRSLASNGARSRRGRVKPGIRASRTRLVASARAEFSSRLRSGGGHRRSPLNTRLRDGLAEPNSSRTSGSVIPPLSSNPSGHRQRLGERGNRSIRSSRSRPLHPA